MTCECFCPTMSRICKKTRQFHTLFAMFSRRWIVVFISIACYSSIHDEYKFAEVEPGSRPLPTSSRNRCVCRCAACRSHRGGGSCYNARLQHAVAVATCGCDMRLQLAVATCGCDMQLQHAVATCGCDMWLRNSASARRCQHACRPLPVERPGDVAARRLSGVAPGPPGPSVSVESSPVVMPGVGLTRLPACRSAAADPVRPDASSTRLNRGQGHAACRASALPASPGHRIAPLF